MPQVKILLAGKYKKHIFLTISYLLKLDKNCKRESRK